MINDKSKHRNKVFDGFIGADVHVKLSNDNYMRGVLGYDEAAERYYITDEDGRKRLFNKCKVQRIRRATV